MFLEQWFVIKDSLGLEWNTNNLFRPLFGRVVIRDHLEDFILVKINLKNKVINHSVA